LLAVACLNGADDRRPADGQRRRTRLPRAHQHRPDLRRTARGLQLDHERNLDAGAIPQWTTSTSYVGATTAGTGKGAVVFSNSNVYVNLGATGTSGATAPTGTTTSSDGTVTWTYVCALASLKQVNPADTSVLDGAGNAGWYNARQNWAITPDNILNALKNQQQRCAMNGVELGLGREGCELWVPYTSEEDFRLLTEVMRELAGSGQLSFSPIVVGGTTTTFANAAEPRVRPREGQAGSRDALRSLVQRLAAACGSSRVRGVPPRLRREERRVLDQPRRLRRGVQRERAAHRDVHVRQELRDVLRGPRRLEVRRRRHPALVNEGVATQSGLLIDFNYTGAAS
jgi:hypothetical protein